MYAVGHEATRNGHGQSMQRRYGSDADMYLVLSLSLSLSSHANSCLHTASCSAGWACKAGGVHGAIKSAGGVPAAALEAVVDGLVHRLRKQTPVPSIFLSSRARAFRPPLPVPALSLDVLALVVRPKLAAAGYGLPQQPWHAQIQLRDRPGFLLPYPSRTQEGPVPLP